MSDGRTALILLYHRIAASAADPWGLCVSPRRFAEQLDVLREWALPVALTEPVGGGRQSRPPVAVTFDDGYADNFHDGLPLLERAGVPATVFVATGYLGGRREFWWEIPERVLLRPGSLPGTLRLPIGPTEREWELGDAAEYPESDAGRYRDWRAWTSPPTARHALYYSVWEALRPLEDLDRAGALAALVSWAGAPAPGAGRRTLTRGELAELAASPLIEIGAHTVTHPMLSALPADRQRQEIEESKAGLEALLGRPIASFAYPYGAPECYTAETRAIVAEAGFERAYTTVAAPATAGADPLQLPRVQVGDWDGSEFRTRLAAWWGGATRA